MKQLICDTRQYLQSELFLKTGLVSHGFTGKTGGVSQGKIEGLNLGFRVGDDPNAVFENYRLMTEDLSLSYDRMALSKQTHTDNIRIVTEKDAGKGLSRESDIEDTDGLITNLKNLPLLVFTADCLPLLLLDPKKQVIAAIHSGWKGTVKKIGAKAVSMMQTHFHCDPKDILAAIGPCIGPCCMAFDKKDAHVFDGAYLKELNQDKVLVDLWTMNKDMLLAHGLLEEHIDLCGVCTVCHSDEYYSYRTHKEHTGRQGAVIALN